MLPRERVIKALNHQEPDRVPIDFGMGPSSGIVATGHQRLLDHLGLPGQTRVWQPWLAWADTDMRLLERFGCDFIRVASPVQEWKTELFPDGREYLVPDAWHTVKLDDGSDAQMYRGVVVARRPVGGHWYDPVYHPLQNATEKDLDDFNWMPPFSFYNLFDKARVKDLVAGLKEEARYWRDESDLALVGWFGGSIFEPAQGLRGYERFFMDFINNQGFIEKLMEKLVEANLEYAKYYLEATEGCLQVLIVGGEDIGAQGTLQISPQAYRQFVKPYQQRLWHYLKRNTEAKLVVHCCGYIEPIIGDLIEAGIDIINPVQISAGMDAARLKANFGDRVTFWGGACDTQTTLPFGMPDDVRRQVAERLDQLAPGGGFVFSAEQTIQDEVPVENILAFFQAAHEFGRYPININY